jgi:hypothetical protein
MSFDGWLPRISDKGCPMTNLVRIAAAAVVLCCAADVQAQNADVAASLQRKVKAGDHLTITTLAGTSLTGRLVRAGAEGLVIQTNGGAHPVAYADIARVRRRTNGIRAGLTYGLLAGVLCGSLFAIDDVDGNAALAVTMAAGVGTGVGLDALIGSNRTIFRRPAAGSPSVAIRPTRGGAAIRWTASW